MVTIICKERVFDHIEAIIFDKDGTLEDSHAYSLKLTLARVRELETRLPGIAAALLNVFGIKNGAIDPAGLMAVGSRRENELATAACIAATGSSWFTAKQIARETFIAASKLVVKDKNSAPLFSGCLATIEHLKRSGLKLGILSADSTAEVQAFVERFDLTNYIQLTMGVDGELDKPDPRLFVLACRELSVAPNRALMVGDSLGDMAMATAAQAAGTIGIDWSGKVRLSGADAMIFDLSEIQTLLSGD